ncbi:uncharacterized protein [Antedon mediterranea]|uniref:uncharacterized protein n=1 Tax=Antedon mediterranea TaxID=105859 RepID=UPI003AF641EF
MEKSVLQIAGEAHLFLIRKFEKQNNLSELSKYEIIRRIVALSESYTNSYALATSRSVDFNDIRYQAAYMFQYFSALCHSVGYGLDRLSEPLFWHSDGEEGDLKLNVCSIGGGPGTDVLGFYMYLQRILQNRNIDRKLVINAKVIDRFDGWRQAWDAIKMQLEPEDRIHLDYIRHDLNEPATEEVESCVAEANVILMFKFISAVTGVPNMQEKLSNILRNAPRHAYLIFGDNIRGGSTEIFYQVAKEAGFELINDYEEERFGIPAGDEYVILHQLEELYDRRYQNWLGMHFKFLYKK